MKAIKGKARGRADHYAQQRRGLLAKVHIAIKDLGILEEDYRDMLEREFFVTSAAALSLDELERLVARFEDCGWRPRGSRGGTTRGAAQRQAEALRKRALALASGIENGDKRFQGMVRKICGVERIEWCQDTARLKRLLAALGKIRDSAIYD